MKTALKIIALLTSVLLLLCSCGDTKTANIPLLGEADGGLVPLDAVESNEVRISFVGCGDNIMYYGNWREAKSLASGEREYDFSAHYKNIKGLISSADIAFINQETVMSGAEPQAWPRFNSPRDLALDLYNAGFDVINLANNHMLDMGEDGFWKTVEHWQTLPVALSGVYENDDAEGGIAVVEKEGIKIAFLSFTQHTNMITLSKQSKLLVPYFEEDFMRRQIRAAKKMADLVFVSAHWGDENVLTPNATQKKYAKIMADEGVDVILGHHSHTIQPVEWVEGENGHRTLCVYSLGNFVAEQDRLIQQLGGMISFDIVASNGQRARIENPVFIPTVIHFNRSFYENQVCLLEDYTDKMESEHGLIYYGVTMDRTRLIQYVKDTVSAQFLPEYFR